MTVIKTKNKKYNNPIPHEQCLKVKFLRNKNSASNCEDHDNDTKHTANALKAYPERKTHNRTLTESQTKGPPTSSSHTNNYNNNNNIFSVIRSNLEPLF